RISPSLRNAAELRAGKFSNRGCHASVWQGLDEVAARSAGFAKPGHAGPHGRGATRHDRENTISPIRRFLDVQRRVQSRALIPPKEAPSTTFAPRIYASDEKTGPFQTDQDSFDTEVTRFIAYDFSIPNTVKEYRYDGCAFE